jgi:hypothetical protein
MDKRKAQKLLVRKPEGNRPLGRPRCRWVYNVKMDILDIGWGGLDWIGLAQDKGKWRALVNVVMLQKSNSIIPQVLLSYVARKYHV